MIRSIGICAQALLLVQVLGCMEPRHGDLKTIFHPLADEAYIQFTVEDREELDWLSRVVSIDNVRGKTVWAYGASAQLEVLRSAGYAWEGLPHPGFNPDVPMGLFDEKGNKVWENHPTYSEYVDAMNQYADTYPNLCRLYNIGASNNLSRPHDLWVLKISDNPDAAEDEPEVFYTSTMHGDETTGYNLLLRLIDEFLTKYGTDSEITQMVDNLEIWINPLHNPDGAYYGGDGSVGSATRSYTETDGSSSWVDPNRNFKDMIEGDHPDGYAWWPETVHMMNFAGEHSFVISANFHGGAEVVNYPYDCQSTRHADNDWWIAVSREYADNCQADGGSSYMNDMNNGITNGYDWYSIHGGRMDFMNHFHGCREVCLEVSTNKNPSSGLDFYWNANRQALLDYLKRALSGIRGTVTDELGFPLPARVEVLGVDNQDSPYVSTDPDDGDYHRLLLPGTYDLRFSSDGYVPQDISGIVVNLGDATRVDVVMSGTSRIDIHGQVFSLSNDLPVPDATVELVGTGIPQAVTSRSGYYSFRHVTEGVYTFRVSAPGYETVEEEHNTTLVDSQVDFGIFRIMESQACDFEQDECNLTAWGSPLPGWQWGSQSSNPDANSGSKMWGTVLGGSYSDDASWNLELLDVWLLKNDPELSFWHWYDIESGYDGGNLKISTNAGQSYTILQPQGGYPDNSITALGEPGYSGNSGGWKEAVFDLSAYSGKDVSLRWEFGSDGSQTRRGWYIDDLRIYARVPNPNP